MAYGFLCADETEERVAIRRRHQVGMLTRRKWGENCFEAVVHQKPFPVRTASEQAREGAAWGYTQRRGIQPDAADPIERQSSRSDLGILCYAFITMGPETNPGTHNNLLGKHPAPELERLLSNELQVIPQTPPCFLWHTWEDAVVKVENSLMFADALRRSGVPFDLHIYPKGPHAIALGSQNQDPTQWHYWLKDLATGLKVQGFIN